MKYYLRMFTWTEVSTQENEVSLFQPKIIVKLRYKLYSNVQHYTR